MISDDIMNDSGNKERERHTHAHLVGLASISITLTSKRIPNPYSTLTHEFSLAQGAIAAQWDQIDCMDLVLKLLGKFAWLQKHPLHSSRFLVLNA